MLSAKTLALAGLALATLAAVRPAPAAVPERPAIVSRQAWGAKPADPNLMTTQTPRGIVIHHTSARQQPKLSLEAKLRGLQGFSRAPGKVGKGQKPAWGDVPYHYYIDAAGRIGEGRDTGFVGDSNTRYDTSDKIQIVLEGHFDQEKPGEAQLTALAQLVGWLAAFHQIAPDKIAGHNDFAATDCPGKNLKVFLPELRKTGAAP